MSYEYLTTDDGLQIHDEQIKRYGGPDGVRDHGALEAAVARPQSGYYGSLAKSKIAITTSAALEQPAFN